MIILKYGDAKKLDESKRWKCRCSKCGCKVILDKDDLSKYKHDMDSGGHLFTIFYWTCPYCETEIYYEEYDKPLIRLRERIGDKLDDFIVYHEELCVAIAVTLVIVLLCLIAGGFIDLYFKHNDKTYNYRIQYEGDDRRHHTDWTNEIEEKYGHVIYIDEDGNKKKQDLDTTIVTDLKEEE